MIAIGLSASSKSFASRIRLGAPPSFGLKDASKGLASVDLVIALVIVMGV